MATGENTSPEVSNDTTETETPHIARLYVFRGCRRRSGTGESLLVHFDAVERVSQSDRPAGTGSRYWTEERPNESETWSPTPLIRLRFALATALDDMFFAVGVDDQRVDEATLTLSVRRWHRRPGGCHGLVGTARSCLKPLSATICHRREKPMPVDSREPTTWPPDTIVVRCGSAQGVHELAERLSRDGSWSVFNGCRRFISEIGALCRNTKSDEQRSRRF